MQNREGRCDQTVESPKTAPMRIGKPETLGRPMNVDAVRKSAASGKRK